MARVLIKALLTITSCRALSMQHLIHFFYTALIFPFKVLGQLIVNVFLPIQGKRMLFTTTVYMHIAEVKSQSPGVASLQTLNDALGIADDVSALELPAKIYTLLWSEQLVELLHHEYKSLIDTEEVDTVKIVDFCTKVVQRTPSWMSYGDFGAMLKDSIKVVESIRHQYHPHQAI